MERYTISVPGTWGQGITERPATVYRDRSAENRPPEVVAKGKAMLRRHGEPVSLYVEGFQAVPGTWDKLNTGGAGEWVAVAQKIGQHPHYRAWLTSEWASLDGDLQDVVVLEDEARGYRTDSDGNETPIWEAIGSPLMHAVTNVPYNGDEEEAKRQAVKLLKKHGWKVAGDWHEVHSGWAIPVKRF